MVVVRFGLGRLLVTPGALESVGHEKVLELLLRHAKGDWGDLEDDDRRENELSLRKGFRLLSAYDVGTIRLWVITEADRSSTTVLLPSEY